MTPRTSLPLLALALAAPAAAQVPFVRPAETPIVPITLDWATGELRREDPGRAPVLNAFDNASCSTGLIAGLGPGEEWIDWGLKSTGLTGIVSSITIGYGTTLLDPTVGGPGTQFGFRVWSGTLGNCAPNDPGSLIASFAFTGLPGSLTGIPTTYALTVNLASAAIQVPDGPLGWSYFDTGDFFYTGPILVNVPGCPTGTVDALDVYQSPATAGSCLTTTNFMQPFIASFFFAMTEDDGSMPASAVLRNTTNPQDYAITSAPMIGSTFTATVQLAGRPFSLLALATTPDPGTPSPFGSGDLLVPLAPVPFLDLATGTHQLVVPFDVTLIGVTLFSQAFRGGPGAGGAAVVDALNGYDLILGT